MMVTAPCILISEDNFQAEVLDSQGLVLVDCWASWCGSSRRINPWLDELCREFPDRIKIGRLNVAVSENLAAQYKIRAVPTLLFFHNGQVQVCVTGSISKQALAQQIKALEIKALDKAARLGHAARGIRTACL
jgi:thioredoxin 1